MSNRKTKSRILIVDDEKIFLSLFLNEARAKGRDTQFDIQTVSSAEKALALAAETAPDVVVTDVVMPEINGMELLEKLKLGFPGLPVIILTAFGDVAKAVEAVKNGAYHYFKKPMDDPDLFWQTVEKAVIHKRTQDELEAYRLDRERLGGNNRLVGIGSIWMEVMESIEKVAGLPTTVLITGETGTGKEMVARAIHRTGARADRPFVSISCVEFAGSLLESELFGHDRGAFTGAISCRRGIFERANGGTLFLDEIAETTNEIQTKLLRVLEGTPFYRVGGQTPLKSDFRLICATNRDLEKEVQEGRFRKDLFYRLNVWPIHLPPLRHRKEDILPLTLHFIEKMSRKLSRPIKQLSGSALTMLTQRSWPGNVRELENLVERAMISSSGYELVPKDFFCDLSEMVFDETGVKLDRMEAGMIRLALARCNHNKTKAAEQLGIARKTLMDKIARYAIKED